MNFYETFKAMFLGYILRISSSGKWRGTLNYNALRLVIATTCAAEQQPKSDQWMSALMSSSIVNKYKQQKPANTHCGS